MIKSARHRSALLATSLLSACFPVGSIGDSANESRGQSGDADGLGSGGDATPTSTSTSAGVATEPPGDATLGGDDGSSSTGSATTSATTSATGDPGGTTTTGAVGSPSECDPLLQDCELREQGCFDEGAAFVCSASNNPDAAIGDACAEAVDCAPSMTCRDAIELVACGHERCCAALCDLGEAPCPAPAECRELVIDRALEHVGFCGA